MDGHGLEGRKAFGAFRLARMHPVAVQAQVSEDQAPAECRTGTQRTLAVTLGSSLLVLAMSNMARRFRRARLEVEAERLQAQRQLREQYELTEQLIDPMPHGRPPEPRQFPPAAANPGHAYSTALCSPIPPVSTTVAPPPPLPLASRLNPQQRRAAEHPPGDGPLLVIAGAGSGKTMTLASRLAWLVQQGADPQRVLLLTFSRRAAAEMARRAGRLLHEALRLPARTAPPTLPWCGTFHGVAARLLREEAPRLGLAGGFTVIDRADAQDLMALARQSLGLAESERRFPLAPTCLAIHSRAANTGRPLHELLLASHPWCLEHESELQRLFAAFTQAKLQQQSLDFDDLLLGWWHVMRTPALAARIGARFDHVLVDEVQDINQLQADLLHALAGQGCRLTAVGDDAQAIYGFRGADVRHVLSFPQRFTPPACVVTLERNYRSTPQVLQASNAVIARAAERFTKTLWTERAAGLLPRLITVQDEAAQARGVADAVLAQREAGLALKRQAVLFRAAQHSAALELELVRRGVPFVKFGGLRFLEAAHVKDVLAVLRWADNPRSRLAALRSARLVPGMGPASVRRLLDHEGPLAEYKPPAAAATPWHALRSLLEQLRGPEARWPEDLLGARRRLVPATPGAAARRRARAPGRPGPAHADRRRARQPRALRHRAHARPARGQQHGSRPAAARRGLPGAVDDPLGQGPGVECRARAGRGRRLHPRGPGRGQRRGDRGRAPPALRGDDARPRRAQPVGAAALPPHAAACAGRATRVCAALALRGREHAGALRTRAAHGAGTRPGRCRRCGPCLAGPGRRIARHLALARPHGASHVALRDMRPHVVGVKGFEPSTLWSQTRCATRLRYTPSGRL